MQLPRFVRTRASVVLNSKGIAQKKGHGGCGKVQPSYRISQEEVSGRRPLVIITPQGHRMDVSAEWKVALENQEKKVDQC